MPDMSQAETTSPASAGPDPRMTYWRSLDELQFTPQFEEFLHREFPQAASEFPKGMSRRRWLQLMGASLSLAGVAGCRWQEEEFLPDAGRVPDYIPGEPQFFSTMHELRGFARALMVRQFDGRPIKVEGNPDHPQSHGATDAFAQACILDLYDPDRTGRPRELADGRSTERTWGEAERAVRAVAEAAGDGARVRVLAGASSSPSRQRLEEALVGRFPQLGWVEYEPISRQNVTLGAQQAFGSRLRPHYRFEAADVILVIDGDPFGADPDQINHSRGWASRRDPESPMNRLYVVESQYSSTGVVADHREPVASSRIPQFLDELEAALGGAKSENPFVNALASDLNGSQGKGLIYVGAGQPAAVHARVHRLSARLGNIGQTVVFTEEPAPERAPYGEAMATLAREMSEGAVDTLVILRGNPAYDAPADVKFAEALAKVENSIHLGEYLNETSRLCRWFLPAAHAFEQWGDGRSYDGTLTIQQPLIEPLHDGRSELELLDFLISGRRGVLNRRPEDRRPEDRSPGEQIVRATIRAIGAGDEAAWKRALHDGFIADTAFQPVEASVQEGGEAGEATSLAENEFEIVFRESEQVFDGRFANNGWLQEVPAFLTKTTWDNVAIFSYSDAARLQIKNQDVVELSLGSARVRLPVYVLPGQAVGSVGVALGYGRIAAGLVGGYVTDDEELAAPVGANVYPLRTTAAMSFAAGVKVEPTGETYPVAITQDHYAIDTIGLKEIARRVPLLVREGTRGQYEAHHDFAQHLVHHPPLKSLWNEVDYTKDDMNEKRGHAWGMSIDLSKCIGCNACVVACQSENNVPIVGKEQVLRGREMHWLRIDRYFRGDPNVEGGKRGGVVIAGQPVLCMHCEHAPCEQVCPVAAAVHDRDGLNLMVYNRCVGTRYCNNNCPYKVRRFNFFNYDKQPANKKYLGLTVLQPDGDEATRTTVESLARMVHNPEVTVRSRGVMEKCTFCIQRIQNAKIQARNENVHASDPAKRREVTVPDGAVQTACGQVCPTGAIVFGDLLDPDSKVSKLHYMTKVKGTTVHPRAYGMLEELNVQPRTAYLARIRNPHLDLEKLEAYFRPVEGHASGHHDTPGGHDQDADHGGHQDEEDEHTQGSRGETT